MLTVKGRVIETKGKTEEEVMDAFRELDRQGLLEESTATEPENEVESVRRKGNQ